MVKVQAAVFAKFEGNTFTNNGAYAVQVTADNVGTFAASNTFGAPLQVTQSEVTTSATWHKFDDSYELVGTVTVAGPASGALLTIADGATLKLSPSLYFKIGTWQTKPGGLKAKNVTFMSSAASPSPGDWYSLLFGSDAMATSLEGCTFSHAGKNKNVIYLPKEAVGKVSITGCTFKDNTGDTDIYIPASSSTPGLCNKYTSATPKNTFDLSPGCKQS